MIAVLLLNDSGHLFHLLNKLQFITDKKCRSKCKNGIQFGEHGKYHRLSKHIIT